MSFLQAFNKTDISLFGDNDKDKVINILDCKPFDKNRDGFFGRALNVMSGGRYGQSKEGYTTEKINQNKNLEILRNKKIELLEKRNKIISQQVKIQKLFQKQQQLLYLQKITKPRIPSPTGMVFNSIFGFPMDPNMPAANVFPGKPGYEIVYEPRLPKGYHWRKIKKR